LFIEKALSLFRKTGSTNTHGINELCVRVQPAVEITGYDMLTINIPIAFPQISDIWHIIKKYSTGNNS